MLLPLQFKPLSLPSLFSILKPYSQSLLQNPPPFITTMNKPSIPSSSSSSSSSSSWSCTRCTFLNPPSSSQPLTCQICLSSKPQPKPFSSHSSSSSSSSSLSLQSPPKWACKACTFLNPYTTKTCKICLTRSSPFDRELGVDDPVANSVGSVFWPLRRCSNNGPVDSGGVDEEMVECVGLVGKRKALEVVGEEGIDGVVGFREAKSVKRVSDLENAEVNNLSKANETAGTDHGSKAIKILTYNVWFREDLEMYMRMQAIGDLIQLHSPDVICMQEITAEIYNIFQCSSWWKKYQCSTSPGEFVGGYFCMQLAKLPVRSFIRRPFSYTGMGRELCIAELQLEGDKALVIATSHLESPCPGPPKWDQTFSKERVAQAKESIGFLSKHQNVIFCGDMNWDDKLDGPFPFPDGWVDSWTHMRPGESGLTYDTKSNKMLSGYRTLQKRLDRVICSLRDFKISGIEMIGMEEIPGLSFFKEKKTKKGVEKIELPVFPSDHFGLLLTITGK